jgi:hypothetical protein
VCFKREQRAAPVRNFLFTGHFTGFKFSTRHIVRPSSMSFKSVLKGWGAIIPATLLSQVTCAGWD